MLKGCSAVRDLLCPVRRSLRSRGSFKRSELLGARPATCDRPVKSSSRKIAASLGLFLERGLRGRQNIPRQSPQFKPPTSLFLQPLLRSSHIAILWRLSTLSTFLKWIAKKQQQKKTAQSYGGSVTSTIEKLFPGKSMNTKPDLTSIFCIRKHAKS